MRIRKSTSSNRVPHPSAETSSKSVARLIRIVLASALLLSALASGTPVALAQGQSQWTHTTVGDFSGCSVLTNTSVTNMNGGEVRLTPVLEDYFDSPTISATRWITGQLYTYGGAFAPFVANGILSVNGSYLRSASAMTQSTRVFEARVRLRVPPANTAWGDIGFGRQNYPGMPDPNGHNRLFITNDANQIFANARNGEDPVNNVLMTGIDPSDWHVYRIVWGQTSADYYIDGVYRSTDTQPSSYNPYVWLYTLNPGGTVEVDWARVDYYPNTSGQFQSCAVDGGQTTAWGSFNWTGNVPAGTSVSFQTRTSPDNSTWSAWSAPFTASGSPITSPSDRYLQYRIAFSTGDNTASPQVDQVTIDLNNPGTPTPTPVTPTPTATTAPPLQWTHTAVSDFSGCSVPSNTSVTNAGGGEVRLLPTLEDYFDGPSVDQNRWFIQTYSGQTTPPTQANGVLTVNSNSVVSNLTDNATTQEVSGRVQFAPNGQYGDFDFGLAYPYQVNYALNALFIIDSSGNLYANNLRDNLGLPRQRTQITGVDVTQYHDFRISVSPAAIDYYVDGVLRVTHAQSTPLINQPVGLWVLAQGIGASFNTEWVRWDRYPALNGTFQSCAIDAGQSVNWSTLSWSGQTPSGTSVSVETRTSNDLVNWSAWSAPNTAPSFAIASPAGRYLQYRLALGTTNNLFSPQVNDVTVSATSGSPIDTPTPTSTATATNTSPPTATSTATSTPTSGPSPTPSNTPLPTATNTATASSTPSPTASNTPPPSATPTASSARSLQFDGVNDYAGTADLPLLTQFTIEAWVNRTIDSGGYQTLLSDATSNYGQAMFALYVDGGSTDCGAGDQFAYFQVSNFSIQCSGVTANLGAWHHIAVTRDGSGTRRFFVDGILRSTQTNSPAPTDSSGIFTLGRAGDYGGEYFGGLLDEIRISNAALYTADFTPPVAPLAAGANTIALWHLDEGSGQAFADVSGNGRNGTLGSSSGVDSADPVWSTDSPVGSAGPTSTPTATNTPLPTNTSTPLPTATNTATPLPTSTATPLPSATPTASNTPAPTNTPGPTATATSTLLATATPTNTATNTPLPTATNTPLPTATSTPLPPTATPTPPGAGDVLYISSTSDGTVGGVAFADEDILAFNTTTGTWSLYFDGSDVGLGASSGQDVGAFRMMPDGSLLFSFVNATTIPDVGSVDDSDIVRFVPTSLGATTAGTFEWYFDGSDVGLTTSSEDIDAIGLLPDGRLILSTTGSFTVSGASGVDEDLVAFTPTSLGATTSGSWALYFDGSDVGLSTSSDEDVNGIWIDPASGQIYLTTLGAFSVTGVSGDGADIFICTPGSLGSTTACTFALYWDGSANGFAGEVTDGIGIVGGGPIPTPTSVPPTATNTPLPTASSTPANTATNTPLPTATNTPLPTATATSTPSPTATPVNTATNTPLPTATNTPPPTATSTPTPPASANFALSFDGVNDFVSAAQVPGTGPLTIEAWIRPAASNANGLVIVGANDFDGWSLELNGGRLTLWLSTNQGWQFNQHNTLLQAGQWYHVAATVANGQARTFVNGVASTAASVGTLTQGPPLRLGGLAGYAFFNGALDELRISNVARYAGDFSLPSAPFVSDANTLGLWSFDEGSGQVAGDESPSLNNGTLGTSGGTDTDDPAWVSGYPFP